MSMESVYQSGVMRIRQKMIGECVQCYLRGLRIAIPIWGIRTVLMCALGGSFGCSNGLEVTGPVPIHDPSQIYARLELSYHTITLSLVPGLDTVTLQATARTPVGDVFSVTDRIVSPVTYRIEGSTTTARVTPEGTLTALTATSRVLVIATQTIGSVTLADTAMVRITGLSTPTPKIASISIQPLPGDSAKVDCSGRFADTLRARALNLAGDSITTSLSASYRSSDPTIATVSANGVIQGLQPGQVTITADAYYYGQGVRDSVRYTIGEPLVGVVWLLARTVLTRPAPVSYAGPADVVIGVGGSVNWLNAASEPIDIVFDDPTAATPAVGGGGGFLTTSGTKLYSGFTGCAAQGGGNIPALVVAEPFVFNGASFGTPITCASAGARSFTHVGTYTYRSLLTDVTGRVIVR